MLDVYAGRVVTATAGVSDREPELRTLIRVIRHSCFVIVCMSPARSRFGFRCRVSGCRPARCAARSTSSATRDFSTRARVARKTRNSEYGIMNQRST